MTRTPQVPTALAIASVHPDYLDACVEGCCTGLKHPPRLEPGTITLLRRTTGGLGGRHYGVVGLWWYTGETTSSRGGDYRWPRRWSYRVQFKPLVLRFEEPFCEMFTVSVPDGYRGLKTSEKIPGLVYTALQGSLIQVRDANLATGYLRALLKEKAAGLRVEAEYRGERVRVDKLLSRLLDEFARAGQAREAAAKAG